MIPSLGQGANSAFEGAHRLAEALRGVETAEGVVEALRAYEVAQMERVHWIDKDGLRRFILRAQDLEEVTDRLLTSFLGPFAEVFS